MSIIFQILVKLIEFCQASYLTLVNNDGDI